MSHWVYSDPKTRMEPSCGFCGRVLGRGFYFTCHVCGATYCYTHRPSKCSHEKLRSVRTVSR